MKALFSFICLILCIINTSTAGADNKSVSVMIYDPPPMNNGSSVNFELSTIAISPFYQYLGIGISYERFVQGDWYWNAIDYHKFIHQQTDSESELKHDFKIKIQENPYLDQYINTGITYKPFHFKWMFNNQKPFWSTINFNFEYGVSKWSNLDSVSFFTLGTSFELIMDNQKTLYLKLLNLTFLDSTIEPEFSISLGGKLEL